MTDARPPEDTSVFLCLCVQNKEEMMLMRRSSFEIPTNGVEKLLDVYEEKVGKGDQSPSCV